MVKFAAVIPAAGSSSRFGGTRNKLLEELDGQSVLAHSIDAFARRDDVAMVVVPTGFSIDDIPALKNSKVMACPGGTCRAESVLRGLECVPAEIEWVAVHDAARPLVSQELIDRTLAAAIKAGSAGPAMAVSLTIKEADGKLPSMARRTLPRGRLWAMQTPQIMRRADLLGAFQKCFLPLGDVTDDLQLLELAGLPVCLVNGEERNLKITTGMDLVVAKEYVMAAKRLSKGQTVPRPGIE